MTEVLFQVPTGLEIPDRMEFRLPTRNPDCAVGDLQPVVQFYPHVRVREGLFPWVSGLVREGDSLRRPHSSEASWTSSWTSSTPYPYDLTSPSGSPSPTQGSTQGWQCRKENGHRRSFSEGDRLGVKGVGFFSVDDKGDVPYKKGSSGTLTTDEFMVEEVLRKGPVGSISLVRDGDRGYSER